MQSKRKSSGQWQMTEAINVLSNEERLQRAQIAVRGDFELFCATCLKIVNKEGHLVPFIWNAQQRVLNERIEDQLRRTGRVRMIVPKSRRAGISTFIGARLYWLTALHRYRKTLIFSHEQTSSDGLFEMVERYNNNNPFAPHVGASNVKELVFDQLDSAYAVATAGAADYGRGLGYFFFHGSEVSRWKNATGHFAGVVQTVPDVPGTEIYLESTGAGPVGEFYEKTQNAIRGKGKYEVCFLPWMLDTYNFETPPDDFMLDPEKAPGADMSEAEYAELYSLTPGQAYWARNKRMEVSTEMEFRQEFPACLDDVFVSNESGRYHDAIAVMRARKNPEKRGEGPLIMGIDPAGEGGDRFSIAFRRGHVVEEVLSRNKVDSEEGALWVASLIDERKPDKVFIDAGGIGRPIISRLRGMKPLYMRLISAVNFGSPSQAKIANKKKPGPKNRRAEMQERLKNWLTQPDLQVSIPDSDSLQADLLSVLRKPDNNNDLALVSKDEMRKKGLHSPDEADAVGLTFAATVYIADWKDGRPNPTSALSREVKRGPSGRGWMAGG